MKIKVKMVIMSHLSDVQHDPTNEFNNLKLNFVKYLLGAYTDTNEKIDVDEVYKHFLNKILPNLK